MFSNAKYGYSEDSHPSVRLLSVPLNQLCFTLTLPHTINSCFHNKFSPSQFNFHFCLVCASVQRFKMPSKKFTVFTIVHKILSGVGLWQNILIPVHFQHFSVIFIIFMANLPLKNVVSQTHTQTI